MPGDWKGRRQPFDSEEIPYASSKRFTGYLREVKPWLLAPEGEIVPLDGSLNWAQSDESTRLDPLGRATCPLKECGGAIVPCPKGRPPILAVHEIGRPIREPCPKCRGEIEPGSLLYCPLCGSSGFERRLKLQREIVGVPPKDPPTKPLSPSDPGPGSVRKDPDASHNLKAKVPCRRERRAGKSR
jgi:hypothetical protein